MGDIVVSSTLSLVRELALDTQDFQANDNRPAHIHHQQSDRQLPVPILLSLPLAIQLTMADYAKRSEVTIQTMVCANDENINQVRRYILLRILREFPRTCPKWTDPRVVC